MSKGIESEITRTHFNLRGGSHEAYLLFSLNRTIIINGKSLLRGIKLEEVEKKKIIEITFEVMKKN